MKLLFDHGTPAPLRRCLTRHQVATADEMGWSQLSNGQLLQAAEDAIDVLITTDKNLKYQQNLAGRRIAILVLPTTSWPRIRQETIAIAAAIDTLSAGQYLELSFNKTRWNRVPSAHEAGGQHTAMLCSGQLG